MPREHNGSVKLNNTKGHQGKTQKTADGLRKR